MCSENMQQIITEHSELWKIIRSLEYTINSLQRGLLRKIDHIQWLRTISSDNQYQQTNLKTRNNVICHVDSHGLIIL